MAALYDVSNVISETDIIDTMVTFPTLNGVDLSWLRGALGPQQAARGSRLFQESPTLPAGREAIEYTLAEMDRFGIQRAVVDIHGDEDDDVARRAIAAHPDRFIGAYSVDPNQGMNGVRALERSVHEWGVRAASAGPAFLHPQVPIDDRRFYPLYAKCVELDIPIFLSVGVPGPRVPMAAQRVELIDEVCYFFPELRIVMRHGAEPWEALAAKLLLKWPNLYYSTSAFAPKHYPKAIIDFANTRGSDKILFAGYFAVGLTYDRIFTDLPQVGLRDQVWPKFLRHNAMSVLKLNGDQAQRAKPCEAT